MLAGAADGGGVLGRGLTKSPAGWSKSIHRRRAPSRLAERIRRWEFVEMLELLLEMLEDNEAGELSDKQHT